MSIIDATGTNVSTSDEYRRELDKAAEAAAEAVEAAARDQPPGAGRAI